MDFSVNKKKAVELYREGKISLSAAAKIASVDIYQMIEMAVKAGIKSDYSLEDMKKERKTAEKLLK